MCICDELPNPSTTVVTTSTRTRTCARIPANQEPMNKSKLQKPTNTSTQATASNFREYSFERMGSRSAILIGFILSCIVTVFSIYFPFMMAPHAAKETYHFAFWKYDESLSHFDNTIWTYGTDYFLAFVMAVLAWSIIRCDNSQVSAKFRWGSAGLLLSYTASTLAGGLAHQTYTSLSARNSLSFQLLWTICVGTVCGASGFMGWIATELARQYRDLGPVPILPEPLWVSFGTTTTLLCVLGGFSYQRPACDIFIAGITQFPSTFYMMALLAIQCGHPCLINIRRKYRIMGFFGFILNAPLLPMYPLLVQYTDWSLASVNTLLHTCLLTAWGLQGLCLRHLAINLARSKQKPYYAVPVPSAIHHNKKKVY